MGIIFPIEDWGFLSGRAESDNKSPIPNWNNQLGIFYPIGKFYVSPLVTRIQIYFFVFEKNLPYMKCQTELPNKFWMQRWEEMVSGKW